MLQKTRYTNKREQLQLKPRSNIEFKHSKDLSPMTCLHTKGGQTTKKIACGTIYTKVKPFNSTSIQPLMETRRRRCSSHTGGGRGICRSNGARRGRGSGGQIYVRPGRIARSALPGELNAITNPSRRQAHKQPN